MIVTVDIGNSHQNYAIFTEKEEFVSGGHLVDLKTEIKKVDNPHIIVSSVNDNHLQKVPGKFELIRNLRSADYFLDMPTKFAPTMGEDRLATCYYLFKQDQRNKVVVDSGTFTTIDFVSSQGHLGGYILPGEKPIRLSYKIGINLTTHVHERVSELNPELPTTTASAIEQGILAAYLFPIKGLIKQHQFNNVFITGGNAQTVMDFLSSSKNDFKIHFLPDLIHRSLCFMAKRNLK